MKKATHSDMKQYRTKDVKLKLPEPACENCSRNTLGECEESHGPDDCCQYYYPIHLKKADNLVKLLEA